MSPWYIKAREFIEAWYSSASVDEVAEKVGLKSRQAVHQKASALRKKGIILEPHKRRGRGLNKKEIDQLKALSQELRGNNAD